MHNPAYYSDVLTLKMLPYLLVILLVLIDDGEAQEHEITSGRTAYQSSTLPYSEHYKSHFTADIAIDGQNGDCNTRFTHTLNEVEPWWAVDFGNLFVVDKVYVQQRSKYSIYNVAAYTVVINGTFSDRIELTTRRCNTIYRRQDDCVKGLVGTGLVIQNKRRTDGKNTTVCLCEVTIWAKTACEKKRYGIHCQERCSPGCVDGECHGLYGNCSNCVSGKTGPKCTDDCSSGRWGKDCKNNCSLGCDGACNATDGYCECKAGLFGADCNKKCPSRCKDQICTKAEGSCKECIPGYEGDMCEQPCQGDKYGPKCDRNCSDGCDSKGCDHVNGTCNCKDDWYLRTCSERCGAGCKETMGRTCGLDTGDCACKIGYTPPICKSLCDDGSYGLNCSSQCSVGCKDVCDKKEGNCSCQQGFNGTLCKVLLPKEQSSAWVIPVAACIGVIASLLVVILVITFIFRRRIRRHLFGDSNDRENKKELVHETLNKVDIAEMHNLRNDLCGSRSTLGDEVDEGTPVPATVTSTDGTEAMTYENLIDVKISDLPDHIRRLRSKPNAFMDEYKAIPNVPGSCEVGGAPEVAAKNRYKNIIAYDESRVHLKGETDPLHSYVNANYIDGYKKPKAFIAAQGALKCYEADFLRMIWEKNVTLVVMVTNLEENGKCKCEKYWPDRVMTGKVQHGDFTVTKRNEQETSHYVTRKLKMEKGGTGHEFNHIQYISWPDHGTPESPAAFLDFHGKAKQMFSTEGIPTLVHCSAGVGRTGTFIAIDYLLDQAATEDKINIPLCVEKMRTSRSSMVQSVEQYIFIHEALLEALHCGQTVYPASEFEELLPGLQQEQLHQFGMLEKVKMVIQENKQSDARKEENIGKNRSMEVLPSNKLRPQLMTKVPGFNDYINGVFVHGYEMKNAFLATQSPMQNTLVDIWRLIQDYGCGTIIALNDMGSKECPEYWKESESNFGPFTVNMASKSEKEGYTVREITCKFKKRVTKVYQFQLRHSRGGVSSRRSDLLAVYQEAKRYQYKSADNRVLVHCFDGVSETGFFLALWHICDKIVNEAEVDVYHAVQLVRKYQPLFVGTLEQYTCLHQAALDYILSYSTYSNFK